MDEKDKTLLLKCLLTLYALDKLPGEVAEVIMVPYKRLSSGQFVLMPEPIQERSLLTELPPVAAITLVEVELEVHNKVTYVAGYAYGKLVIGVLVQDDSH